MFMKTFEEKWTAWLDGELSGKELVEFEASLPDKAAAEAEKRDTHKLGALLKEQLGAHALSNEDFFSHQLRERIVRENGPSREPSREASTWWTVRRLFLTGVAWLALFVICAVVVIRDKKSGEQSQYITRSLNSVCAPASSANAT